ncbi:molybdate transport system permease protein [Carboxydocella sporoproducens DSM 16521]|uniref:Molybdenum transport system permease n=2 Tax=Carboxydocella TaxID=178898 RepID=A0A1T4PE78_9FIRM|nr:MULTISPECIES: molybdate ABC transporter permease subunit [Carboxydocella]AVX21428.1 molybdate transport system permease protein [Carboxydocella thermautotrophica]SJZ89854.1 molybdate transport system permease protein [Carboxydocella sporoproducens DSM 16521]
MNTIDWSPLLLSLKIALLAVGINLLLTIPLAWIMSKRKIYLKQIWESIFILPLVLPPSVVGFGLLLLGHWLKEVLNIQIVFTWLGAFLAATIVAFPIIYQSMRYSFDAIDEQLEMAARSLGAGEWRVFWTITLPLAWPGIVSGLIMGLARALGEFGATLMIAGNIPGQTQTLATAVYYAVEEGNWQKAGMLVSILVLICFCLIYSLNSWIPLIKKQYRMEDKDVAGQFLQKNAYVRFER